MGTCYAIPDEKAELMPVGLMIIKGSGDMAIQYGEGLMPDDIITR
ncbi:hypothetical protein [Xenorhabdus szentirmaii]|nr:MULTISPECIES: hypothetical protein [unclassified Xenorhabdus]